MSHAPASAMRGIAETDTLKVTSYAGVVGQTNHGSDAKKTINPAGSTLIEQSRPDAPPCRVPDGPSALLLTLAALAAMTAGWIGTLRHQADAWSERIGPATLMSIGIAGTIAATRLLQSMTIG